MELSECWSGSLPGIGCLRSELEVTKHIGDRDLCGMPVGVEIPGEVVQQQQGEPQPDQVERPVLLLGDLDTPGAVPRLLGPEVGDQQLPSPVEHRGEKK